MWISPKHRGGRSETLSFLLIIKAFIVEEVKIEMSKEKVCFDLFFSLDTWYKIHYCLACAT